MSKITKQDLQFQINRLYAADSTRHNKMLRMQRALSSLGVDIMSDEFDKPSEPKLKVLDQSVFDGLDEKWRFAATDRNDKAFLFSRKPTANNTEWYAESIADYEIIGTGYDASNWKDSLIERKSDLTGSDLCRAMLARGDRFVMCRSNGAVDIIAGTYVDGYFVSSNDEYKDVTPINQRTGEPLTAKEVGL